jgi:hypothetical protein
MSDDNLKFEIDGPDVHLHSVDAEAALDLFSSFLALVRKTAEERGAKLTFTGIVAEEKCMRLGALPSDTTAAVVSSGIVSEMLARQMPIPSSLVRSVSSFRKKLNKFPQPIERTTIQVGRGAIFGIAVGWTEPPPPLPMETTSFRAYVERAGGKRPKVVLSSPIEDKEMTLTADKALAARIAKHLYEEVDVEALIRRNEKGVVVAGELLEFAPVPTGDLTEVWREALVRGGGLRTGMSLEELQEELGRD